MSSLLRLTVLTFAVLPLAACFRLELHETIRADGTAKTVTTMDMTEFAEDIEEMKESLQESFGEIGTLGESSSGATTLSDDLTPFDCEESVRDAKKERGVISVDCEQHGPYEVTITTEMKLPRSELIIRKADNGTHYIFRSSSKCVDDATCDAMDSQDSVESDTAEDFMEDWTFTVTMPGEILRSNVGRPSGSTVNVDFKKLMRVRSMVIHSVVRK